MRPCSPRFCGSTTHRCCISWTTTKPLGIPMHSRSAARRPKSANSETCGRVSAINWPRPTRRPSPPRCWNCPRWKQLTVRCRGRASRPDGPSTYVVARGRAERPAPPRLLHSSRSRPTTIHIWYEGICSSLLPQRSPVKNPVIGIGSIVLPTEPTEYTEGGIEVKFLPKGTSKTKRPMGQVTATCPHSRSLLGCGRGQSLQHGKKTRAHGCVARWWRRSVPGSVCARSRGGSINRPA